MRPSAGPPGMAPSSGRVFFCDYAYVPQCGRSFLARLARPCAMLRASLRFCKVQFAMYSPQAARPASISRRLPGFAAPRKPACALIALPQPTSAGIQLAVDFPASRPRSRRAGMAGECTACDRRPTWLATTLTTTTALALQHRRQLEQIREAPGPAPAPPSDSGLPQC
jgi:hypothetical protein